jgi:hypothetical protein
VYLISFDTDRGRPIHVSCIASHQLRIRMASPKAFSDRECCGW